MALGDLKPLAVALALHGLLALVLSILLPASAARVGRWRSVVLADTAAIAVDLEWDLKGPGRLARVEPGRLPSPNPVAGQAELATLDPPRLAARRRSAGRGDPRAELGPLSPRPAEQSEITPGRPVGPPGPPPAGPGEWSYGPPPSMAGPIPGLGGPALWALPGAMPSFGPGAPAPTAAPSRVIDSQAANRALRAAVRRGDKRKGLGLQAATTVASVLREAVRAHTPPVSLATFQARLDGSGRLVDVQVLSFSTGTVQMWRRAARQTRARLAARTFPMPADFASGALITVHVQSEIQWPSGSGRAKPVTKRKIEAPRWPHTPQPPPEGYSSRTPPWGPPPKDGVVARFDASDIGAHPTRVVYVRVDAQPL